MNTDQPDQINNAALTVKDNDSPAETTSEDLKAAHTARDTVAAHTVNEGSLAGQTVDKASPASLMKSTFQGWPVKRLHSQAGGEADIYIIEYQGREAVLRLYRLGKQPKREIFDHLPEISHKIGASVVAVHATGHDDDSDRWYEVQEYIRDGSLTSLLTAEQTLSQAEFKAVANQLSEVLIGLHENGIIHRDLKPDNILIRSRHPLSLVLADFGIASRIGAEVSIKETRRANTPLYAAPESFTNQTGKSGDWWSLGVILLESHLGRHPLAGLSRTKVEAELMARGLAVPDGLPPDTALLLKGLLTRDDKKRWRGDEVRKWLADKRDIPVHYETVPSPQDSGQPYKFSDGQACYTLADLAAVFAQEENWAKGEIALAQGYVRRWLENNSRFDEAAELEVALNNSPNENLFLFILKYNSALGPIYKGLPLTFDLLVGYISDPSPSGSRLALLQELADGKLNLLPQLATQAGQPFDELTAALWSSTFWDKLEILRGILAATEEPEKYLWGCPGPPAERLGRLNFALAAGTPLVRVDFWRGKVSGQMVLPEDIINGLAAPATYRPAKENLEQMVAEGFLETVQDAGYKETVKFPGLSSPVYVSNLQYADKGYLLAREQRLKAERGRRMAKAHTNSIGMEFVLIPSGLFIMGSDKGSRAVKPPHSVTISQPFYLSKYQVTQSQWEAVMGNNPSCFIGRDNPVEQVSWYDVQIFIRNLNEKEGHSRYRLPTEAEWEYAARAGTTSKYFFGDDEKALSTYAWYRDNSENQTHPVGQKQPNPWGLYDVNGNVGEWTQDWYGQDYYVNSPGADPKGPPSGTYRVTRGGSLIAIIEICRSSSREPAAPDLRADFIGFRLGLFPE